MNHTLNIMYQTLNTIHYTLNIMYQTLNNIHQTLNIIDQTLNNTHQTLNIMYYTLNNETLYVFTMCNTRQISIWIHPICMKNLFQAIFT